MFSLKNKRVAVFGMGVSGLSALAFLRALAVPETNLVAINQGEPKAWAESAKILQFIPLSQCFSEGAPQLARELDSVDLVILSPGIPRDHDLLGPLHAKKVPVWGEIELAYRYLESENALPPMVGITGTNGKTTTTTFLGEMIANDRKKVFVGGNIGVPFCNYALQVLNGGGPVDVILLELSSFQLESIDRFHLDIALLLNLHQNHGERYATIEEYGHSKFFITNRFTDNDILIYAQDFPLINQWAQKEKGQKRPIDTAHPDVPYDLSGFKLPGLHNRANLAFVVKAAEALKLSPEAILKTINTFKGVHHRIEWVEGSGELSSFKIFNDAKSTNWDATMTAVKAMKDFNRPIHLIIGGKRRGHGDSIRPYLHFFKEEVAHFYLIGDMAEALEEEMKGKVDYHKTGTLKETFSYVRAHFAGAPHVLLFSPGFPSFDQFKNYADRGEHFVKQASGAL